MSETANGTSTETTKKPTSGLAIAGLVLGIIAILGSFIPIINNISFIIAIVGGILATVALVGAVKGKNGSKGMAIAGVVLAVVSIALVLITQSAFKSTLDKTSENLKSGSQPVETSQSQQSDNKGEQSDQKENKESKDYSNMALGETVTLEDGLTITVNSVNRGLTKYDGSPLVSVNVTYTNTGDKSASFNTFDWKSEDANGVQQSTYFSMDGENRLESGKLSPGGTVTGNLFFEGEPIRVLYFSNMFQNDSKIGWSLA